MSNDGHDVHDDRRAPDDASVRRVVSVQVLMAAAVETVVVVLHFAYGAHRYDEPERLHVVAPALGFLAFATLVVLADRAWPRRAFAWLLVAEVTVVYVGVFGAWHGAFGHGLKLLFFAAGASAERLEQLFDSPDFVVPNDVAFELTGLLTLVAAFVTAWFARRLVKVTRFAARERG